MKKLDKIIFASSNTGKINEIKSALDSHVNGFALQSEYSVPDIAETGSTFIENAILKAKNACNYTSLPAIGDDSGLMIDALNGEPGIYSARYATRTTDSKAQNFNNNINKVLTELNGITFENRTAAFCTVIAFMEHKDDPMPKIFEGMWHGNILLSPEGKNGFGYDPIFYVPTHKCSAASLPPEVKNQISARGQALAKLINYFNILKTLDF